MSSSDVPKRVPIWLDCDPDLNGSLLEAGHDDAFAILMCAHHPKIDFLGISTVHGNASLLQTTANASSVLIAIGRQDVPVYPGASKPFCRRAIYAPNIHGATGLDGTDLLPPPQILNRPLGDRTPAITAMYRAVMAQPARTAWVVTTGTLTNVALLLAVYPDVAEHLAGVSIMGGAFEDTLSSSNLGKMVDGRDRPQRIGNTTPWAEFNIYCDPESAQAVLGHEGLRGRVIVIPLDITHTVLATSEVLGQVLRSKTGVSSKLRQMMHDLLVFFANTYATVFGLTAGPPLHDPVAVAAVLHREGVEARLAFLPVDHQANLREISVITAGRHSDESQLGRTVKKNESGLAAVYVPDELDVAQFWKCLNECLDRADAISTLNI